MGVTVSPFPALTCWKLAYGVEPGVLGNIVILLVLVVVAVAVLLLKLLRTKMAGTMVHVPGVLAELVKDPVGKANHPEILKLIPNQEVYQAVAVAVRLAEMVELRLRISALVLVILSEPLPCGTKPAIRGLLHYPYLLP